jgi:hypothetical protein
MIIGQIILGLLKQIRMSHPETDKARGKELKAIRKRVSRHA